MTTKAFRGYEFQTDAANPLLSQSEMTIWFRSRDQRNLIMSTVERKAPEGVAVTAINDSPCGWGLKVDAAEGADDAATDDAIDLLMDTALGIAGLTIAEELADE